MNSSGSTSERQRIDRDYHDRIGHEYDRVIVDPRRTASDILFDKLDIPPPPAKLECLIAAAAPATRFCALD